MSFQAYLDAIEKNGATISDRHVGTTGAHRDTSTQLHLDGLAHRQQRARGLKNPKMTIRQ